MSGFLYFRPSQTRNVSPNDTKAWGLSYAFESTPVSRVCHIGTPTGTAGVVFGEPGRHGERIKMDLEAQEWRKMPRPGQDGIYIGYWKDSLPGPDDLARKNQLSGYILPLADGRKWHIPVVRAFDESAGVHRSNLPCYVDVDETGQPIPGQPLAVYAHLWELTAPFAEQMMADADVQVDFDGADINHAARTLLQTNYLVDWIEIAQSKILTTEQMALNIICIAIDWPTYLKWREVSKKKTPSPVTVAG